MAVANPSRRMCEDVINSFSGERCSNLALFGERYCGLHLQTNSSNKKCAHCGNAWNPDRRGRCGSCGAPEDEEN